MSRITPCCDEIDSAEVKADAPVEHLEGSYERGRGNHHS